MGAPACAPRPSRPRRPSAGPRSRLRPPGSGLRPGRESRTRRGGRFLSGPGKEGPGPGRAPAVRGGLTSRPARPRLASVRWRRSSASSWKASLPRSAPSRPGPTHIAIAANATAASRESARHRRSAPGPAPRASMRSRLGPQGAPPASATCVQQVPARGPAPAALPSPSSNAPPSLRRGPALSGLRAPPRWSHSCCAHAGANRDFKICSPFPARAPVIPREPEACVSREREPGQPGSLRG